MNQTKDTPGRNDPCHCGSGRKYKQCCLKQDEAAEREARAKAAEAAQEAAAAEPEPVAEDAQEHRAAPRAHSKRENQPWKKAVSGGAHPTQRRTTHRKVGSS